MAWLRVIRTVFIRSVLHSCPRCGSKEIIVPGRNAPPLCGECGYRWPGEG